MAQHWTQKNQISEEFSWFDIPSNIDLLFNIQKNADDVVNIRHQHGFKRWWRARNNLVRLKRTLKSFLNLLRKNKIRKQMLASHYLRKPASTAALEQIDIKLLCQYLCGDITADRLLGGNTGHKKLSGPQLKAIEPLKATVQEQIANADLNDTLLLLSDFVRFRQKLKYYRFAHRVFNRIKLLTVDEEIKLSLTAGTLYLMPISSEIEEENVKIAHHAILKADVRGSTTVTEQLQLRGLNPASYFSMRFFNPINKIMATYDANKVFVEGDAIILSFLEYEHAPQQWFSVARACGYARDMLKVVGSNNRYSRQMGLPLLELGVGICYSDEAPQYLFDEEKPIMISGAIGLADRLSSCSWNLRESMKRGLFSVEVLRIVLQDSETDDKGQRHVRYNVNGVLIDNAAFDKLKVEIPLTTVRIKLNGEEYLFHVGQYPDTKGRVKDLVIREGKVGIWQNSQIQPGKENDESFFEVVVNRKVIPLVLESTASKQLTSS